MKHQKFVIKNSGNFLKSSGDLLSCDNKSRIIGTELVIGTLVKREVTIKPSSVISERTKRKCENFSL